MSREMASAVGGFAELILFSTMVTKLRLIGYRGAMQRRNILSVGCFKGGLSKLNFSDGTYNDENQKFEPRLFHFLYSLKKSTLFSHKLEKNSKI